MAGIEAGDAMEFDHIGDGTLRLKKRRGRALLSLLCRPEEAWPPIAGAV